MIEKKFNNEDIVVRIRPKMDSRNYEWTGEIDISIISFPDNPLDDEDYSQLMHFTKMMCASVPIIEEVETFRNLLHDYLNRSHDGQQDLFIDKPKDSNIIHLKFLNGAKRNEEKD